MSKPLHRGSDIQLDTSVENELRFLSPGYIEWNDVPVEFETAELLADYSSALYERLSFELGDKFTARVSNEELTKYLMTLVMLRIHYVTDALGKSRDYDRFLVIPAFMSQYLKQIGIVIADGLGVKLVPSFSSAEVLPPADALRVSQALRQMKSAGLEFTDVMPRDKHGEWDFMSLQHVGNEIVSHHDEVHPSLALAGAFVSMKQVRDVFNPLVTYGSPSSYARVVSGLVESNRL